MNSQIFYLLCAFFAVILIHIPTTCAFVYKQNIDKVHICIYIFVFIMTNISTWMFQIKQQFVPYGNRSIF